jgi:hypothetical protein
MPIFNEDSDSPNLQPGKFCFSFAMKFSKDNKETYDKYFRSIFEEVENFRMFGIPECE